MNTQSPPEPRVRRRKRLLLILCLLLLLLLPTLFILVTFRSDGESISDQILGLIGYRSSQTGSYQTSRRDISGLSTAVGTFTGQFGVSYMPSQIVLREDGAYNLSNQLDKDSITYLQQMFGKRLTFPIDWNGDGILQQGAAGRHQLTGDQCLVFFLGGIPNQGSPTACLGFSTSSTNPAEVGGNRIAPVFEFKSSRLVRGANGFFSYKDGFNQNLYAYFSSYKTANGYNRYGANGNSATSLETAQSDCANLGVSPYVLSTSPHTVYVNAAAFQILSAGPDGEFGAGGTTWPPSTGYPSGDPGADDLSNFSSVSLGAPQQ